MTKTEPPEGFPTPQDEAFFAEFRDSEQPEAWRVPVHHRIPCSGCGQYLTHRRTRGHFEGDYEIDTHTMECRNGCTVSAEITYREYAPRVS